MKKLLFTISVFLFSITLMAQKKISITTKPPIFFKSPVWLLKGNARTNSTINFLGTTDEQPLVFRVNNQTSGYLDFDSVKGNAGFGYQALQFNTSIQNSAFGYRAMAANIGGELNVAVGNYALAQNSYGLGNTAVGASSLVTNSTGSINTAIGADAMFANTLGSNNVAIGANALQHNEIGGSNVAVGYLALVSNNAYYNTALGEESMYSNTTGTGNAATGEFSLFINTTGNNNTALGYGSMFDNGTGSNNTAVGSSALFANTTGSNNTAIGYNANEFFGNLTNATAIGYNAFVDSSNKVRLGNDNVMSVGGEVGWTNYASDDIKQDIKENVPGLQFIKALRPVTYNLNIVSETLTAKTNTPLTEKANKFLQSANRITNNASKEIGNIRFTGLIAQEVAAAAKVNNYSFSGIDKNGTTWGLRYSEFVMPLIKAVQELNKMNDDKDTKIDDLQKQINDLKTLVLQSNQQMTSSSLQTPVTLDNASLQQNTPNPVRQSTTISYLLPANYSNAKITISNDAGQVMKILTLNNKGAGQITIDASTYTAGNYFYSLLVDGKNIMTKQMTVTK